MGPRKVGRFEKARGVLTNVGLVGMLLVVLAAVFFSIALSQGVHCPECDKRNLGDRYAWWAGYFLVKDVLWVAGGLAGLLSVLVAARKRWGAIALALALALLASTPM